MERWEKVIKYLGEANFRKIWRGKNLEFFYQFLKTRAEAAGGFLITFPLEEGGFIWFFYPIKGVKKNSLELGTIEVRVPSNPSNRDCPNDLKGYPVWRASAESAKKRTAKT